MNRREMLSKAVVATTAIAAAPVVVSAQGWQPFWVGCKSTNMMKFDSEIVAMVSHNGRLMVATKNGYLYTVNPPE